MTERPWYTGYTPKERDKNFAELKRQIAAHELGCAKGPCALCGDPSGKADGHFDSEVKFEYHNEDYSLPLCKTEPGLVVLGRHCHRNKLHKRFADPIAWQAYIAHIRRGGYARDLKNPSVAKELKTYRAAMEKGESSTLRTLGPYHHPAGREWFTKLRMDIESLKNPEARPRP